MHARYPVIVITTAVLAGLAAPLTIVLYEALRDVPPGVDPTSGVVWSAVLAGIAAAVITPPALAIARRSQAAEADRVDW
jgi:hypothetical protein